MSPDPNQRYENVFSLLFGRDACSDAFGSASSNSICSPSDTLCCIRRGQPFPSCQQHLGKGWCCVGNNATDNCYVDQPSVCEEPNAVTCTNLAKGVTKACCPRLTTCSNETAATKEYVRCNIQFADLKRIDQAESSSSSSFLSSAVVSSSVTPTSLSTSGQSTPATTTTALAGLTTTAAIQTPLPPPADSPQGQASSQSSASLPAGLIGGAAVGATLGFVSLVLLGYLFFRKQAKKRRQQQEEGGSAAVYPQPQPPLEYSHSQHSHHQGVAQKGYGQLDHSSWVKREIEYGYQPGVWSGPPVEVDGDTTGRSWEPAELPSERWK